MIDWLIVIYATIVVRTLLICYMAWAVYRANLPEWFKIQVLIAAAIALGTAWIVVFNPTAPELLTDLTMIKILATNISFSLICVACISLAIINRK